ncbi:hypothetical protein DFH07DRAFT_781545 [Mycena maculata]|uniref:Uncharacterized protein n=1 Tax=Mycena maculata TaxID=230809 RepID=A0AAD7MSH4_9AGAR|nr:hypothetical protein DFH07DRAFT_781545 [Mycena maculata]
MYGCHESAISTACASAVVLSGSTPQESCAEDVQQPCSPTAHPPAPNSARDLIPVEACLPRNETWNTYSRGSSYPVRRDKLRGQLKGRAVSVQNCMPLCRAALSFWTQRMMPRRVSVHRKRDTVFRLDKNSSYSGEPLRDSQHT